MLTSNIRMEIKSDSHWDMVLDTRWVGLTLDQPWGHILFTYFYFSVIFNPLIKVKMFFAAQSSMTL